MSYNVIRAIVLTISKKKKKNLNKIIERQRRRQERKDGILNIYRHAH